MSKILLAEDDSDIRESLLLYLQTAGFAVTAVDNGLSAYEQLCASAFDLLVTDIAMPGLDGIELLKKIRGTRKLAATPVILLSAKNEELDVVLGLELGADDYITKPFSARELVARIKSHLRKKAGVADSGQLVFSNVRIDLLEHRIFCGDSPVALTNNEFDLLKLFFINPRHSFSREELLTKVWNDDSGVETRTVDQHIKNLRKKLLPVAPQIADAISSVRGIGYQFDPERLQL